MLASMILVLAINLACTLSAEQTSLQGPASGSPKRLQISAVVNEDHDPYNAKIECWKLDAPFSKYPTVGEALSLGDVTNMTYVTLPPRSQEGLHHPPHNMFFILLSGVAHVGLPGDPSSGGLWIREGVNPLSIATDTMGVGHYTDYPSDKSTVALQVPFKDGVVPEHTVIADAACEISE